MTADPWTERLSEYVDGDLDEPTRLAIDAHVATCADCAAAADGLRAIVQRAASLDDRPPAVDLWPGIAARLETRQPVAETESGGGWRRWFGRRLSLPVPQLAAATVLLAVVSALVGSLARSPAPGAAPEALEANAFVVSPQPVSFADPKYDAAVADLTLVLERGRDRLEPRTREVLERSLASIDRAIDEARGALARDPASADLSTYLAAARRKKLDLLRKAADITMQGT